MRRAKVKSTQPRASALHIKGMHDGSSLAAKWRFPVREAALPTDSLRARSDHSDYKIPVMRPRLPDALKLLPYLQRIDFNRIYSNFGPLSGELEHRLQAEISLPEATVVCASSGTSAIVAAILAMGGGLQSRRLAVVPSFTFAATGLAVEMAGYTPYFMDVDPETWLLDPAVIISHPLIGEIGLVVPVAAYGRPVQQKAWREFQEQTGIPVVIDGAASFSTATQDPDAYFGSVPVALSFHATKSFAAGEGGAVVWSKYDARQLLIEALNFGFFDDRLTRVAGTNGKMSEYHAAVGLAELDDWPAKRDMFVRAARSYRIHAEKCGFANQLLTYPDTDFCYPLLRCSGRSEQAEVEAHLASSSIGTRRWYGQGLISHPHFSKTAHDDLSVSTLLGEQLIGLPMAVDMAEEDIDRVCAAIRTCLRATVPVVTSRPVLRGA